MLDDKRKQNFLAIFIVFILLFLQFLNLLNFSFLIKLVNSWKEKNFLVLQIVAKPFNRLAEMWRLSAKLEDLQYRYSETAATAIRAVDLEKENQELRKILENSDRSYSQSIVTAPVISFAQSFVAAGNQSGVKVGSVVLYKDTLLGLIDKVEDRQSSVLLLSQMLDKSLLVETNTGVKGLLRGNGREILLTEVPSNADLQVGQLVMTSSQIGLEKSLLIGRVSRIIFDNQALATKTAVVEQLVNFYEANLVEIK